MLQGGLAPVGGRSGTVSNVDVVVSASEDGEAPAGHRRADVGGGDAPAGHQRNPSRGSDRNVRAAEPATAAAAGTRAAGTSARLLGWARASTAGYDGVRFRAGAGAWGSAFRGGRAFAAIVHAHAPSALDYAEVAAPILSTEGLVLEHTDGARVQIACEALERLGVPRLLPRLLVSRGQ